MYRYDVNLTTHAALIPGMVMAVLAQKSLRVTKIRLMDREPGLTDDEAAFARLLGEMTNGSVIEVNETGTAISIQPGSIRGGSINLTAKPNVHLILLLQRLLPLAPFAKAPLNVVLAGGYTDGGSCNADYFRNVTLPFMEKFGVIGAELHVDHRAALPGGGGLVRLTCPNVRRHLSIPRGLDILDGRVVKVRGVAYALRTSPQLGNRVAQAARDELRDVASDVFFSTDCRSNKKGAGGNSPSFGMSIWAEIVSEQDARDNPSSKVMVHSMLGVSDGVQKEETPEATGQRVANEFLKQVAARGMVDDFMQPLLVTLMAVCPQDVVRARVGQALTPDCIQTLRCCKTFLSIVFKIVEDRDGQGTLLSCVGAGTVNLARKIT